MKITLLTISLIFYYSLEISCVKQKKRLYYGLPLNLDPIVSIYEPFRVIKTNEG